MTTIEPGVVERLVERLLNVSTWWRGGRTDAHAELLVEAATLLAQQQARIGEMEGAIDAAEEIDWDYVEGCVTDFDSRGGIFTVARMKPLRHFIDTVRALATKEPT